MIFYCNRISVKEGIDTETYEHNDRFINEILSKRCNGCCVLFYNRTNFNYKEQTCDSDCSWARTHNHLVRK